MHLKDIQIVPTHGMAVDKKYNVASLIEKYIAKNMNISDVRDTYIAIRYMSILKRISYSRMFCEQIW